jgi:ribosomal protein S18 acetylase RimI-like enzyme
MLTTIRRAVSADGEALAEIDRATWSGLITPAARWPADRKFFDRGLHPRDVLVAVLDGAPIGYAQLGAPTPLASNSHVLELQGLAVIPHYQRHGIGRQLLGAAIDEARARGARRLRARVLAPNHSARELYTSVGFEIEGVLRDEFLINGAYVDDVLIAIRITGAARAPAHGSAPSDGAEHLARDF